MTQVGSNFPCVELPKSDPAEYSNVDIDDPSVPGVCELPAAGATITFKVQKIFSLGLRINSNKWTNCFYKYIYLLSGSYQLGLRSLSGGPLPRRGLLGDHGLLPDLRHYGLLPRSSGPREPGQFRQHGRLHLPDVARSRGSYRIERPPFKCSSGFFSFLLQADPDMGDVSVDILSIVGSNTTVHTWRNILRIVCTASCSQFTLSLSDQIFLRAPKIIRVVITLPGDSFFSLANGLDVILRHQKPFSLNHTLAMLDAHLVHVGANIPCLDPDSWLKDLSAIPDDNPLYTDEVNGYVQIVTSLLKHGFFIVIGEMWKNKWFEKKFPPLFSVTATPSFRSASARARSA